MKHMKKRLALFLCVLLAMPAVLGCLPRTAETVQAASGTVTLGWSYELSSNFVYYEPTKEYLKNMQAEAGTSFGLDYLVYTYRDDGSGSDYMFDVTGESYASSNPNVATVDKNGTVTVKAAGDTVLTVSYKGAKTSLLLNAVPAKSLGSTQSKYNTAKKLAKKLNGYGTKVTAKNRYKIWQTMKDLSRNVKLVSNSGFARELIEDGGYYRTTNKLVIPELLKARMLDVRMTDYAAANNPVGTTQSKWFKISKVSAKKNTQTFTITLKKKVTTAQLFAIKYMGSSDTYHEEDGQGVFGIVVKDKSTGHCYYGRARATVNSKQLVVTMNYLRLKKGKTYQLMSAESMYTDGVKNWTKGKTFKVK